MLPQVCIPIIQFCLAYKKGLRNYHILVQNFQQEAYNTWRKKKRIFKEDYINFQVLCDTLKLLLTEQRIYKLILLNSFENFCPLNFRSSLVAITDLSPGISKN